MGHKLEESTVQPLTALLKASCALWVGCTLNSGNVSSASSFTMWGYLVKACEWVSKRIFTNPSVPQLSFIVDRGTVTEKKRRIWSSPPDHQAEEFKPQLNSKSQKEEQESPPTTKNLLPCLKKVSWALLLLVLGVSKLWSDTVLTLSLALSSYIMCEKSLFIYSG